MKRPGWTRRPSLPDRTVRIIRALRYAHGWTYRHLAEHHATNIWTVVSICSCNSRNAAGIASPAEALEAKLIHQTWQLHCNRWEAQAIPVPTIPRTHHAIGSPCPQEP